MTTYESSDFVNERPAPDVLRGPRRLLALIIRYRQRRRTLQCIAHLDAVQLQDIGLDPDHVADAMNGDGAVLWTRIPRLR